MNLITKQKSFSLLVARLILKASELGYEVTLGECWRPPEMAAVYAEQGKGITNSLHWSRLAIDLNLFRDGKYLSRSEDHRELGEWWESQSTDEYELCWGGRFSRTDGNHYSLSHNGVR